MNHIDQKILELYVLNDEAAQQHRVMIESHLAECAGCRELYARMQDLYAGFFDIMASSKEEKTDSELSIKQKKSFLVFNTPSPLQEVRANYEIEHAPIRKTIVFARKHPIVTSTISFFVVGFFTLLGLQVLKETEKFDDNPSFYRYTKDDKLEIYNSKNQLLWFKLSINLENEKLTESLDKIYKTHLADLNGDGKNEVITTLLLEPEKNYLRNDIKVFDGTGKLIKSFQFPDESFQFRNLKYESQFRVGYFYCLRNTRGEFNLFTTAGNSRSPTFFVKLDSNLNIVGRYWNYGNINFKPIIVQNNNLFFALTGKNDVNDISMKDFSILAIIDPEKLAGDEESSTSEGFGYKKSQSEIYYIKFPETDMEKKLKIKSISLPTPYEDSLVFSISVEVRKDDFLISFVYVFNKKDFSVKSLKFNTGTERLHARLKYEGVIQSTFDLKYLETLKNRVEYWNGEKWVYKPVLINNYRTEK